MVFLYIVKGVLITAKYIDPLLCKNDTSTTPVEGDDSSELQKTASYPFTVGVYAFVSVVRCIEYIPLICGLYQFCTAQSNDNRDLCQCNGKHCVVITLLFVFTLLPLSIPSVGIALEHTDEKKHCGNSSAKLFYAYCVVNFFRYFWSFTVRAGMVVATLRVREVWKKVTPVKSEHTLATLDTSPHTQQTVLALKPNQNTGHTQETDTATKS